MNGMREMLDFDILNICLCNLLYKHKIPQSGVFKDLETNFKYNHSIKIVVILLFYVNFTAPIHF